MRRSDFHYDLPDTCIAQRPPTRRGDSRLLHLERATGRCTDRHITDLPTLLAPGDLLVLNDTRVIPARLHGRKASGGAVEIFVERVLGNQRFSAKIRASKTPKPGTELTVGEFRLTVGGRDDELFLLQLTTGDLDALLAEHGHIPLPPYIRRPDEHTDRERYQTVWAREPGAVAAPTAGLHFDDALLDAMRARGVGIDYLTLHVGAGTYQRVRTQDLSRHQLHAERVIIGADLVERINATRRAGGRIVAVGTTVVRSLEAAAENGELTPFADETRLFIRPGYRFRVVDALLTNFHEPESTLLMLVCAFAEREPVLEAYRHAVDNGYRFLSYGDAMWLA